TFTNIKIIIGRVLRRGNSEPASCIAFPKRMCKIQANPLESQRRSNYNKVIEGQRRSNNNGTFQESKRARLHSKINKHFGGMKTCNAKSANNVKQRFLFISKYKTTGKPTNSARS